MSYKVKTSIFEGPFDLLFHLIKKAEIDIYEVSIHQVVYQYLEYVEKLQELNSDLAGDFLVMAATLLKLKSQKLLPIPVSDSSEEDEEEIYYSSEEELFEHLMEYRKYKAVTEDLKKLEEEEEKYFTRPVKINKKSVKDKELENILENVSLQDLICSLENVIIELDEEQPEVILPEEISINGKMDEILSYLINSRKIELESFLKKQKSKAAIIITFLALLTLIKIRKVTIYQKYTFGPVIVYYLEEDTEECRERWKVSG